jgi:hypothetical protein
MDGAEPSLPAAIPRFVRRNFPTLRAEAGVHALAIHP